MPGLFASLIPHDLLMCSGHDQQIATTFMKAGWQNRTNEYYAPGSELDDDLTVLDHIDGTRKVDIYLCKSKRLNEVIACKVLRPEFRLDFSELEAVARAGQLLERL
jgi:hypothetical protein